MMLVAAYLVWVGAHAPGGAFQAGSVLGAVGVLLRLSGMLPAAALDRLAPSSDLGGRRRGVRLHRARPACAGRAAADYPSGWAKPLILAIELTATLSIGIILAALFIGGRP
jgi:multisubunit Na+/H+ antiporter MnhB subunit